MCSRHSTLLTGGRVSGRGARQGAGGRRWARVGRWRLRSPGIPVRAPPVGDSARRRLPPSVAGADGAPLRGCSTWQGCGARAVSKAQACYTARSAGSPIRRTRTANQQQMPKGGGKAEILRLLAAASLFVTCGTAPLPTPACRHETKARTSLPHTASEPPSISICGQERGRRMGLVC